MGCGNMNFVNEDSSGDPARRWNGRTSKEQTPIRWYNYKGGSTIESGHCDLGVQSEDHGRSYRARPAITSNLLLE